MFMIPMPPTSSAIPPSENVSTRNVAVARCASLTMLA